MLAQRRKITERITRFMKHWTMTLSLPGLAVSIPMVGMEAGPPYSRSRTDCGNPNMNRGTSRNVNPSN